MAFRSAPAVPLSAKALPWRSLALAVPVALLFAGCATPPPRTQPSYPPVYQSVRPENLPPDSTFSPNASPVLAAEVNRLPQGARTKTATRPAAKPAPAKPATSASAIPAPAVPAAQPAPARPAPKATVPQSWRLSLEPGHRRATLNGVQVWLLDPAVPLPPKKKGGAMRSAATEKDILHTIGPIINAPTNAPPRRTRPLRVFLDPGHGGDDSGAVSGNRKESAIALDIARRLAALLRKAGCEVRISRRSDAVRIPLEERPAMAAKWRADLFVSIHLNASANALACGVETYALPPAGSLSTEAAMRKSTLAERTAAKVSVRGNAHDDDNIRLAWCVHRSLVAATGRTDRGVRRARFVVLREATVPAILVEVGFLSNTSDSNALAKPAGREQTAVGISRGILDWSENRMLPNIAAASKPAPKPAPAAPAPAKP